MLKKTLTALTMLSLSSTLFAANIVNLYDAPNDKAKTTASLDLAQGYMPIFTQADGKWVKIADPKNGNVGWVKADSLEQAAQKGQVSYSQQFVSKGEPNSYHVVSIQNGVPQNPEKSRQIIEKIMAQQAAMQREHEKAMSAMFQEMNELFKLQFSEIGPIRPTQPVQPVSPRTPAERERNNPAQTPRK